MNKEEIIEYLAKKYKRPEHIIERIMNIQFKFVAENMRAKTDKDIMIKNLGRFVMKKSYTMKRHEDVANWILSLAETEQQKRNAELVNHVWSFWLSRTPQKEYRSTRRIYQCIKCDQNVDDKCLQCGCRPSFITRKIGRTECKLNKWIM